MSDFWHRCDKSEVFLRVKLPGSRAVQAIAVSVLLVPALTLLASVILKSVQPQEL